MNTDRYQGNCFISEEGWKNMESYDELEPRLRRRLAYSPFNLCPACVGMFGGLNKIEQMEDFIRSRGGES